MYATLKNTTMYVCASHAFLEKTNRKRTHAERGNETFDRRFEPCTYKTVLSTVAKQKKKRR